MVRAFAELIPQCSMQNAQALFHCFYSLNFSWVKLLFVGKDSFILYLVLSKE